MLCDISPGVARKGKSGNKTETIGISASPETKADLEKLADHLDRSVSNLAGKFLLRGWAAYRRDKQLDEPTDEKQCHRVVPLKVVGRVSAGQPIEAIEEGEDVYVMASDVAGVKKPRALRVVGNSMGDAGVLDGDIIIVGDCADPRNRIVVVYVEEKGTLGATLKMWRQKGQSVTLEPANPDYEPETYPAKKLRWYGMLVKVLRTVELPEANEKEDADAA